MTIEVLWHLAKPRPTAKPAVGRERVQSLSPSPLPSVFKALFERGATGGKALSPRTVQFAPAVLCRPLSWEDRRSVPRISGPMGPDYPSALAGASVCGAGPR